MDINYYEEIKYNNIFEFISETQCGGKFEKLNNYIFRGEDSDKYSLLPSALRQNSNSILRDIVTFKDNTNTLIGKLSIELAAVYNFYNTAKFHGLDVPDLPEFYEDKLDFFQGIIATKFREWIPDKFYEIFGLAQHYGIPTRLLDWTYDFNIALYFAIINFCKNFVMHLKNKLSISGNFVIWLLDYSTIKLYYNNNPIRLIVPRYAHNANLCAQKGIFTLVTQELNKNTLISDIDDTRPFNEIIIDYGRKNNINRPLLYKLIFPNACAISALSYLLNNNYSKSKIFPGYASILDNILENNLWNLGDYLNNSDE